jgi:chromate reductase, NAD(P)H dehydrogenase (quinone)
MRLLTLCGSLRAQSSNRAILRAYGQLAPAGVRVGHYEDMGGLPHFNPDLDVEPLLPEVAAWRGVVGGADALAISTPEYVHALPGSFKNALDWLVSDPAFAGKPVALLHAVRGSSWALDSLREVLVTMSARIVEPAAVLLPFTTNQLDEAAILAREDYRQPLLNSLAALVADHAAHAKS